MASIRKRSENSYFVTVSKGYDSKKKKLFETKTITIDPALTPKQHEKELRNQVALFEAAVKNGTYLDGEKMTFAELIEVWTRDHADQQLEDRTKFRYKEIIDSRILPALGHIKLQKLQPTHLLQFYNNLQESGIRMDSKHILKPNYKEILADQNLTLKVLLKDVSLNEKTLCALRKYRPVSRNTAVKICTPAKLKIESIFDTVEGKNTLSEKTIKQHHAIIHSILEKAVQWQLILSNPADRVKPPKVVKTEARHLKEDAAKAMLEALQTEPLKYQLMVYMDLATGMRRGELMALKWSDIDFVNKTISVTKALTYVPGAGQKVKTPKNETSIRKISIPRSLITLLNYYKLQQNGEAADAGDIWAGEDWIFTKWDGKPMHLDTITKWFPEFMNRHDLASVNFHAIRHTAATLLINQGLNVRALSARLGHANSSTTLNIYSHALRSADEQAAEMMENIINPKKQKGAKKPV